MQNPLIRGLIESDGWAAGRRYRRGTQIGTIVTGD